MLKYVRGLVLGLGLVAVAGSATASSYGTLYKNQCQLINGTLIWDQGRIANDSGLTALQAHCPTPGTSAMTISSAAFIVWDRNTAQAVECTLANTTSFNNDGSWSGFSATANSGVAFASGLTTFAVDITDAAAGYVWTACSIPTKQNGNLSSIGAVKVVY